MAVVACEVIVVGKCEMLWRSVVKCVDQCGDLVSMFLFLLERLYAEICGGIDGVICVVVCVRERADW